MPCTPIPHRPTFYSYVLKFFSDKYHIYQFNLLYSWDYLCKILIKINKHCTEHWKLNWRLNWTLSNKWTWSSCKKLALKVSWIHCLIAQLVRTSEWNSLVKSLNPTQAKFLYFLQFFRDEYCILYINKLNINLYYIYTYIIYNYIYHPPPPPAQLSAAGGLGLNFLPNFEKGDLGRISILRRGLLGKRWVTFFRGCCSLYMKNKLKSEETNDNYSL